MGSGLVLLLRDRTHPSLLISVQTLFESLSPFPSLGTRGEPLPDVMSGENAALPFIDLRREAVTRMIFMY